MKTICVVSGGRSDYGLLKPIMLALDQDPMFNLVIIATGMHLMVQFGNTWEDIERDGFYISKKIDINLDNDQPCSVAVAMGDAIRKFATHLTLLKPDLLLVLGDRYEIFSACAAATALKIPIAHIHGGETTQGANDEAYRHSITKMAHLHFVAAEGYRNRVIQLGELPERVFNFGSPAIDSIQTLSLLSRDEILEKVGLNKSKPYFLITFHPATLETNKLNYQINCLLNALNNFKEHQFLFTETNSDADYKIISHAVRSFTARHSDRSVLIAALGQLRYLSALKWADAVVGNSSSALIEAPSFQVSAVNIGDRQLGRISAKNVIHTEVNEDLISSAIERATSPAFKRSLLTVKNPYGNGNAVPRIVEILKQAHLGESCLKKIFYDIPGHLTSEVSS